MAAFTPSIFAMLFVVIAFQVLGAYLLPLTKGFTEPVPAIISSLAYFIGLPLIARMLQSGVNLSIIMPMIAAIVPLATIAIGVLAYGEAASLARISALVAACLLVGLASAL